MRYTIVGRNIEVTPGLREAVEDKIGKLDRYFTPDTEVNVTMSVQRERQNIEVTIIRAEESSSDMYVSIDLVEEVIERQILKYKKKLVDRKQSSPSFSDTFLQEDTPISEDEIKIVKTKKFAVKPMEEIIERQLKRYKTKLVDQKQSAASFSEAYIEEEADEPETVQIVRTKRFAVKPMDPEEACLQMELLGHSFYVFLNSESDQVCVVYRRKGGTYGLIEPEF